ncbi:hypothetical protein [Streptomyces alkaliphilus]|uniref:hypothetical protein n=1 Tax=Streptomyces alkaliphilus TaxID=1472722 RepID=UPI00117C8A8E|nr:hypothetical protein [Streptomyces alkaliphilus]MQS10109.1 hypothetical protein [Streptomyces alkaliphilus]
MSPATGAMLEVIRDLDARLGRARDAGRAGSKEAPAAGDLRLLEDRRRGAVRALRAVVAGRYPGEAPEVVEARLTEWGVVP